MTEEYTNKETPKAATESVKSLLTQNNKAATEFVKSLLKQNSFEGLNLPDGAKVFKVVRGEDGSLGEIEEVDLGDTVNENVAEDAPVENLEVQEIEGPEFDLSDAEDVLNALYETNAEISVLRGVLDEEEAERVEILKALVSEIGISSNRVIELLTARKWMSPKLFKKFSKEYIAEFIRIAE